MCEAIDRLPERYDALQKRIRKAAGDAGRNPAEIKLVAVTKTWPAELVVAAYELGLRDFGENRPEELAEKRPEVEARLGKESGITWHLIGPLQSRKTSLAAEYADYFHALDRLKIARRLSSVLQDDGDALPVLLQVNVSGEDSKHGFDATAWEESASQRERLQNVAQDVAGKPGLVIRGLMTMAPWQAPANTIARVFERTAALAEWLTGAVPDADWSVLSMGMTDDFELAILNGATHIRVGRALFGDRS